MKKYELTDLPSQLPLLPLNGFTLLPRMQFPVSIDEPHSIALMEEALRTPHRMIGIIQPRQTIGEKPALFDIGTAVRIMAFEEQDDGKYTISVAGVCRFRLVQEISTARDYRLARVDYSEYQADLCQREPYHFKRSALVKQLHTFFDGAGIAVDWDAIGSTPDGLLVNSLSILCPFDVAEKQALLEAGTIEKRLETLQAILTFATTPARERGDHRRVVH